MPIGEVRFHATSSVIKSRQIPFPNSTFVNNSSFRNKHDNLLVWRLCLSENLIPLCYSILLGLEMDGARFLTRKNPSLYKISREKHNKLSFIPRKDRH